MVGHEDARRAALSRVSDKMWLCFCTEYGNARVFSRNGDMSFGGLLAHGQKVVRRVLYLRCCTR